CPDAQRAATQAQPPANFAWPERALQGQGKLGAKIAVEAAQVELGVRVQRQRNHHRAVDGFDGQRAARVEPVQLHAHVAVGSARAQAAGAVEDFDVAIHRAQLPDGFDAEDTHRAVYRRHAAQLDVTRHADVVLDRNFDAFVGRVVRLN